MFENENMSSGPYNAYRAVLKENNELKKNNIIIKSNLDKSKINGHLQDEKVSESRSDIK